MDFEELYPSNFLRAGDLGGSPMIVTVGGIKPDVIGGEKKVVMTFSSGEKALILNKTNGKTMAKLFGRDTTDWIGKRITLIPAMVDFKGDTVEAIRIRTVAPAKARVAAPADDEPPAHSEDELAQVLREDDGIAA